jgi:hypothetical protein
VEVGDAVLALQQIRVYFIPFHKLTLENLIINPTFC